MVELSVIADLNSHAFRFTRDIFKLFVPFGWSVFVLRQSSVAAVV